MYTNEAFAALAVGADNLAVDVVGLGARCGIAEAQPDIGERIETRGQPSDQLVASDSSHFAVYRLGPHCLAIDDLARHRQGDDDFTPRRGGIRGAGLGEASSQVPEFVELQRLGQALGVWQGGLTDFPSLPHLSKCTCAAA